MVAIRIDLLDEGSTGIGAARRRDPMRKSIRLSEYHGISTGVAKEQEITHLIRGDLITVGRKRRSRLTGIAPQYIPRGADLYNIHPFAVGINLLVEVGIGIEVDLAAEDPGHKYIASNVNCEGRTVRNIATVLIVPQVVPHRIQLEEVNPIRTRISCEIDAHAVLATVDQEGEIGCDHEKDIAAWVNTNVIDL